MKVRLIISLMTTLTILSISYSPIYAQPQPKLGEITSQLAQNINQQGKSISIMLDKRI